MKRRVVDSGQAGKTILAGIATIFSIIFIVMKISNMQRANVDYKIQIPEGAIIKNADQINYDDIFFQLYFKTKEQLNQLSTSQEVSTDHKVHDGWPFKGFCGNLKMYQPSSQAKILSIKNNSKYDAVVFVHGRDSIYSAFVKQKTSYNARISNTDYISLYPGKEWSEKSEFQVSSFCLKCPEPQRARIDSVMIRGIFTKTDSSTLRMVGEKYQFKCSVSRDTLSGFIASTSTGKLIFLSEHCTIESDNIPIATSHIILLAKRQTRPK